MDAEEVNTSEPPQSEENVGTVGEICRVCLLEGSEMRDLFVEDPVVPLSNKAMSFTSVKVRHVVFRLCQYS